MKTDFKIHRLTQHANGEQTAVIRFYEGDITTEYETPVHGRSIAVTRYRRTRMIGEETYGIPAKTDLHKILKGVLKKDKTRSPIPEQDA